MNIDPYILTFALVTVVVTVWMGFRSAKTSKTASDFFVAGRSVGVGMNASAISGEYLSAASFMGVAGMVMSSGYDALWYSPEMALAFMPTPTLRPATKKSLAVLEVLVPRKCVPRRRRRKRRRNKAMTLLLPPPSQPSPLRGTP